MRATRFVGLILLLSAGAALAAEKAVVMRPTDLKDKPFVDAASVQKVAANQPVTVLVRQGGWAQVDAGGRQGWVRVLNLKLDGTQARPGGGLSAAASLFRTGSSGKTVTTGVKGLDEENIRNASPDRAALARLDAMAVSPDEARSNALAVGLAETQVPYLKKGQGK